MQNDFKSAYADALSKSDEMLSGLNIIMNPELKQKLTAALSAVKEQMGAAQKVASRAMSKAQYEAEMAKRIAEMEQVLNLVTVIAKKSALQARLVALTNSISQIGAALPTVQPQQQNNYRRGGMARPINGSKNL